MAGNLNRTIGGAIGLLGISLSVLLSGCSDGGSAKVAQSPQESADLSAYGLAGEPMANPRGDVAVVMGVGLGDGAPGEPKTGVSIHGTDGVRTVVDLPDGHAPSSWGVVGDEFVVTTHLCSEPEMSRRGCDVDRGGTRAYVVGSGKEPEPLDDPPPFLGSQILNRDGLAIWQTDDGLVTFDRKSSSWTASDLSGPTSPPTLSCPTLGLQVVAAPEGQALISATSGGLRFVTELPGTSEGPAPRLVACADDGIVEQVEDEFRTFAEEGLAVGLRSVAFPEDMRGSGWQCSPIVGPVPAAFCAQDGTAGSRTARLVLEPGSPDQTARAVPPETEAPRAIVGLPEDSLGLLRQNGEIDEI